ncbi:hypothetical protein PAT3040_02671 [Paenibacillus agaridevorans]|uniref:Uncharacterized protein n=1 Tax=Paenibacillus agaridevorans TaxID=171404 RepID=A0A2R5EXM1_9BACL|nr:hypothetical protein [Paenibacillus agaridevorans]GBG08104.1 hypothetical protein PAT3040_02671 [Paenibacillus agaridevorans]
MWSFILIILLIFWVLPKFFVKLVIPKWAWKVLGVFLVIMIIYNADAAFKLVVGEAKAWFPVVQSGFTSIMTGMREFITTLGRGGTG